MAAWQVRALAELLPSCPRLEVLELRRNDMTAAGAACLADAVRGGAVPSLLELSLQVGARAQSTRPPPPPHPTPSLALALTLATRPSQANLVCDDGLVFLSSALQEGALPKLARLNLSFNCIGTAGLVSFAAAVGLGALAELSELDLDGNEMGDGGLAALAKSLKGGALPRLAVLQLEENDIGDAGVRALAAAASTEGAMASLAALHLEENAMAGAGVHALADALDAGERAHASGSHAADAHAPPRPGPRTRRGASLVSLVRGLPISTSHPPRRARAPVWQVGCPACASSSSAA